MSHLYTCMECGKIAAELTSLHKFHLDKREGFDLYECGECGARYVMKDWGLYHVTKKTKKALIKEFYEKMLEEEEAKWQKKTIRQK